MTTGTANATVNVTKRGTENETDTAMKDIGKTNEGTLTEMSATVGSLIGGTTGVLVLAHEIEEKGIASVSVMDRTRHPVNLRKTRNLRLQRLERHP